MGGNIARRLMRGGHEILGFDHNATTRAALGAEGFTVTSSLEDLAARLEAPRVFWVMLPAGAATESTIDALIPLAAPGDIIVDGGNSFYKDDIRRAKSCAMNNLHYVDVGTSGGVWGLQRGYCMMIGGDQEAVERLDPVFDTLAPGSGDLARTRGREGPSSQAERGYIHAGPAGAGHFVKMVHNGIEYGLMAAYAEGLNVLRGASIGRADAAPDAETAPLRDPAHYRYQLDVAEITELWRRGSVVGSWLLDLTAAALAGDPGLEAYDGHVSDSGEGRWTVQAAVDEGVPVPVLSAALFARFSSRGRSDFGDRVLSAMRHAFGGHLERRP
jgi:6-phosphogluconate dehydrogenase